jgi:hypothetical protein
MMHLTLCCEVHYSKIIQRILDSPENGDQRVLSGYASSCVFFICGFSIVTPLFSVTPILGMCLENSGVMLPKSRTEDT